jgi:hypothetical protein
MYNITTITKFVVIPIRLRVYKEYTQAATHLPVFPWSFCYRFSVETDAGLLQNM